MFLKTYVPELSDLLPFGPTALKPYHTVLSMCAILLQILFTSLLCESFSILDSMSSSFGVSFPILAGHFL